MNGAVTAAIPGVTPNAHGGSRPRRGDSRASVILWVEFGSILEGVDSRSRPQDQAVSAECGRRNSKASAKRVIQMRMDVR